MATVKTVDITPTPEGFAAIAETFADSILRDVPRARIAADAALLGEVVKVTAMLQKNGHEDAVRQLVAGLALVEARERKAGGR